MGIENFDVYSQKFEKILLELDNFCDSIEHEVVNSLMSGKKNAEIESVTEQIKRIKTSCKDKDKPTKEKTIPFLYQHAVSFLPTDKVEGSFPISENFLPNMIAIFNNRHVIRHSHVTDKFIGYAHDFCNERARENYYTIPVFAHNQFRFDFFFIFERNST